MNQQPCIGFFRLLFQNAVLWINNGTIEKSFRLYTFAVPANSICRERVTIAALSFLFSAMFSRIRTGMPPSRLRRFIAKGGIIAYPTESCFGIGCHPRHAFALRKVVGIKKRPQHKGLIVIGKDLSQFKNLLQPLCVDDAAALSQIWPAAKTFVLPAQKRVLPLLRGKQRDKLAVRVPAHETARALCAVIGSPLVSTSCNRAGKRACRSEREVRRQFGRQVHIVGGRTGCRRQPSEIIDWHSQSRLR